MGQRSVGFKLGLVLAILHLLLFVLSFFLMMQSKSSTGSLVYMWCFFVDSPLLFLPKAFFQLLGVIGPLIQFGVLGTMLWFFIPWLVDHLLVRIYPACSRGLRWGLNLLVVLFAAIGISALSTPAILSQLQQDRPAELKAAVNTSHGSFLSGEEIAMGGISTELWGLTKTTCRSGVEQEIVLHYPQGVVFLDTQYKEQWRWNRPSRSARILPIPLGGTKGCGFLVYQLFKSVSLFDPHGKETWAYPGQGMDGFAFGDTDDDGIPEIAIYHTYREGIHLLGVDGNVKWKHPVYSLGHTEFSDLDNYSGKEIIFCNSNNADGNTLFTSLNYTGNVISEVKIPAQSYEFAMVHWPPGRGGPHIMLTEENQIRIFTQNGEKITRLPAPGCRTFGKAMAVTVRFKNDEPEYLAVLKRVYPDLQVLYVYNPNGDLVYQLTDESNMPSIDEMITVPSNTGGTEDLLLIRPGKRLQKIVTRLTPRH